MSNQVDDRCIRLWLADDIPDEFRGSIPFAPDGGVIVVFLSHLPQIVLESEGYRKLESLFAGDGQSNAWMRAGELGLFGTNALNAVTHPGNDGILLIGSCV